VIPTIGSTFDERDEWAIVGFLSIRNNDSLLRAAAIQYCGVNHGLAAYVMHHYRNAFVDRLYRELAYVNMLDEQGRMQWLSALNGVASNPASDPALDPASDPDTVTFIEDRTSDLEPNCESYPVVEPEFLCLETAEELSELLECVICHEDKAKFAFNTTNCGHSFCHGCIVRHIQSKELHRAQCPLCRNAITSLEVKDTDHYENIIDHFSTTAYILKECSQMEFGNCNYVKGLTVSEAIHKFFIRFESNTEFMTMVNASTSYYEEALNIWKYIILCGPIQENHTDPHYLDDFDFHPDLLLNFS
jgi:hypothetical protein